MRTFVLRALAALAGSGAVVMAGAPAARADCLAADVIVHRTNQPDLPVLTDGQCLVPTPFAVQRVFVQLQVGNTATGVPSGVTVELWVPFP